MPTRWYLHVTFRFRFVPVLMAHARIFWDQRQYAQVEKLFRKSVEHCNENDTWKLNVAHVLFMQVCFFFTYSEDD